MEKEHIELNRRNILVTGATGFIGYHIVLRLLKECTDSTIIGIDNFTDYYDVKLKEYRCEELLKVAEKSSSKWILIRGSIAKKSIVEDVFNNYHPLIVVNLAAQAGVRYSIENPEIYIESNIIGFYNILEACRYNEYLEHLVYASSSSVYGGNKKVPFKTSDYVDHPVSLYAATKKSNELLAHSYSKLYNIPSTGLRFFTVYGPAGRPDMAYFSFTEKLRAGEKIDIFNYGNCMRDFTYVDDIVDGVIRVMAGAPKKEQGEDGLPIPPYAIYNIGGGRPENLIDFVHILVEELSNAGVLEKSFDIDSHLNLVSMQPGDVPITYADASALEQDYSFKPGTGLRSGLREFAKWYKDWSNISQRY